MKPLIIRFQAFGPYKNEEIVDFQKLSNQGLFLICGETGSGKTTILDAMTFALFGKSSGGMRNQMESMRCKQSDWGVDTFVQYDFELHGSVYRFERKLECKKVKLSASQNVYLQNEDGIFDPIFENCREKDINTKAKELLGLDYEQFRQVIILPQGQFEKLLTSASDEKEKILVSIFGVDKWQKIANYFYENAAQRRHQLLKTKEQLEMRLQDENCSTLEQFEIQLKELQRMHVDKQSTYAEKDYDGKRKQLDAQRDLAKQFFTLRELQQKLLDLENKKAYFAEQERRLHTAEKAEMVKPVLEAFTHAASDYQKRAEAERKLGGQIEQRVFEEAKAKQDLEFLLEQKVFIEKLQQERIRLEERRSYYEGWNVKEQEFFKQKEILEERMKLLQKAETLTQKTYKNLEKVSIEYKEIREDYTKLSEMFLAGIVGNLAANLKEGMPCPVCGSVEHPAKAEVSDVLVTEKDVKEKETQMHFQFEAIEIAQEKYQNALQEKEEFEHICAEQKNKVVLAEKELENAKGNLIEGIVSIQDLEKQIAARLAEIERFQKKKEKFENIWKEKQELLTELKARVAVAKEETLGSLEKKCKAEELVKEKLKKAGFADVDEAQNATLPHGEMQKFRNDLAKYQAEIKHVSSEAVKLQACLEKKEDPNLMRCEEELIQIAKEKEEMLAEIARIQLEVKQKEEKLEVMNKLSEAYKASWTQAETDWALAKNLRGDTGIGLQRYVLGVMFSSVIAAANKMLEKVHGGRYRLFRSDEKGQGSNKKGLELKVFDSFSREGDEGRSVKTLSGGEKFLVSLALSIGMSTVAQKSGTHLDAMFVDEGFGSLDQNSIEDALEVLASIQKANAAVGIISHVQVLQDHIPTKLEIKKSRDGSKIVTNIG